MPSPSCPVTIGNFPARKHNKNIGATRFPILWDIVLRPLFSFTITREAKLKGIEMAGNEKKKKKRKTGLLIVAMQQ